MADENQPPVDGIKSTEELELDLNLVGDDLDSVKVKAEKATTFAKQAIARAKKAEEELKTLKGKPIINSQEQTKPSDILKSPEFRLHREGYNEDEIELIMRNGGPEILKQETSPITLGLRAARDQRQAEIEASKVAGASGTSDIERKFTEAQMRAMSKEELEKLLPQVIK